MIDTLKRLTSVSGIVIIVVVCCFDINEQRLPDALTYISVLPNAARGSRCDSQSAARCFIRHAVVCVHSALSPLFSLSLWPARRALRLFLLLFFLHFTLTIDHFLVSHATVTQMHTAFEQGHRAVSLQGRGVEDPLRLRVQCEASRNPMLNTQ